MISLNNSKDLPITVYLQWLEHNWLVYHGCFELDLESLGKNPIAADLGYLRVIFCIILKMVYCLFSSESPRRGDSNENTKYIFILKEIGNRKNITILPPDLVM